MVLTKTDIFHQVRQIEIKTRALTANIFAGEYHSAFKGRGMSFAEVRGYQVGDNVRDIDWNVTARLGSPHVKVYEEERELTVMLLIDVSRSLDFGTQQRTLRETVLEVAATLAFSAIQNNDKIGVVLFSDRIEKFIPPKKGRKHILYIIREVLAFKAVSKHTSISCAVDFLMKALKKKCISFILSDFLDEKNFEPSLMMANQKHDVIAIRAIDKRLYNLSNVGLLRVFDAETEEIEYIDTDSQHYQEVQAQWWQEEVRKLEAIFQRCSVDYITVDTQHDYVHQLIQLFSVRNNRK